jgi:hypothetical protein
MLYEVVLLNVEPTYLVVSESGVQGRYKLLEDAKQMLNGIRSGNRLIAEVKGHGVLNRDPLTISGKNQTDDNGFNKLWYGVDSIIDLMDTSQKYLDSVGKL